MTVKHSILTQYLTGTAALEGRGTSRDIAVLQPCCSRVSGEQESVGGRAGGEWRGKACSASRWEPQPCLLFFGLKMSQDVEDNLIAEDILTLRLHHAVPLQPHAAHQVGDVEFKVLAD